MRYEENHESLEAAKGPTAASAAQATPAPMNPLTRAAIDASIKKIRDGLVVEASGIFEGWSGDVRTAVEDAVALWLEEQFETFLKKGKVAHNLQSVFANLMIQETEDALREIVRDEVSRAMSERSQW